MKTVLTVDDSKVVRSVVSRFMKPWNCELVEATDGKQGLEAARNHKPDLILLDTTMPVMDGHAALTELRKDPQCKSIPVIILTVESEKGIAIEVGKLGVVGCIIKPFQKETFDAAISEVLGEPSGVVPEPGATLGSGIDAPLDHRTVPVVDDSECVLAHRTRS